MIDTHCHLTDPRLEQQLDAVLDRAQAAGVTHLITIGTDLVDDHRAVELCRRRDHVRCAVGIHPNYVTEAQLDHLPAVRHLAAIASVLAIGEMGLDYHYDYSPKDRQAQFFEAQLQMAVELNKPAVIHCRQAVEDCLAIMRNFPTVAAVFHCFTGTPHEAHRILDAGYLLGITGVVTFKKSDDLRQVVREMPAERLLLETDAPYLTPEPFRKQKTNEPAMVIHTAAEIARIRSISVEDLNRITTENTRRLFHWPEVTAG